MINDCPLHAPFHWGERSASAHDLSTLSACFQRNVCPSHDCKLPAQLTSHFDHFNHSLIQLSFWLEGLWQTSNNSKFHIWQPNKKTEIYKEHYCCVSCLTCLSTLRFTLSPVMSGSCTQLFRILLCYCILWRHIVSLQWFLCLLDTVASVTPNKVRDVRMFLNGSAMDVMYYTSPLYRTEVSSVDFLVFNSCIHMIDVWCFLAIVDYLMSYM